MNRRSRSPDTGANKRIKLDSPGTGDFPNAPNYTDTAPFYQPLYEYLDGSRALYNNSPPADISNPGAANGGTQLKVAQLELEKAQLEKDSLALRLELARLQSGQSTTPAQNDTSRSQPPPQDQISELNREVELFRNRVASIEPPQRKLRGSAGYRSWMESIKFRARVAGCYNLLERREEEAPVHYDRANKGFWWEKNDWLYAMIWECVQEDIQADLNQPRNRGAFTLWKMLQFKFRRPIEEERAEMLLKIFYDSHSFGDTGNTRVIEEWGSVMGDIGYEIPQWLLVDVAILKLSTPNQDLVRSKMKEHEQTQGPTVPFTMECLLKELPNGQHESPLTPMARTREPGHSGHAHPVASQPQPQSMHLQTAHRAAPTPPLQNSPRRVSEQPPVTAGHSAATNGAPSREDKGRTKSTGRFKPGAICGYCHKKGHEEDECRGKASASKNLCEHCRRRGHADDECWFKNSDSNKRTRGARRK